jgi:hypothetical protein
VEGIGMQLEVAPPVENYRGLASARFHWNFATKDQQASGVAFQKDLKCLRHIGLEGVGAAAAGSLRCGRPRGLIGRLHRSGAAPFAHSRSNGVRLVRKGGQADA